LSRQRWRNCEPGVPSDKVCREDWRQLFQTRGCDYL